MELAESREMGVVGVVAGRASNVPHQCIVYFYTCVADGSSDGLAACVCVCTV